MRKIKIGKNLVEEGGHCYIIAEIGINHNGDINLAKDLIKLAKDLGCDAVKFQKRTVDTVYTREELALVRQSVFGETNGDLKRGLEFGEREYTQIDEYCKKLDIDWFASCWDEASVDFIDRFNPPAYKIASACITDDRLLRYTKSKGKPILLSTGMSTMAEIAHALEILGTENTVLYHCTSTYPTDDSEINLQAIQTLKEAFGCLTGYSGHEKGIFPSVLAAAYGAVSIERHITLDRTLWGSDQAASLEPEGLRRMVRDIRKIQLLKGDGVKKVYDSELPIIKKLRRVGASAL